MTKEKLYPIQYNNKLYYEKDCDVCFSASYTCKKVLNDINGVYMADGLWVYPDGSMGEW